MIWVIILGGMCAVWWLWRAPSECISFYRYIIGALFGTSAIVMAGFSLSGTGGWVSCPMFFFFILGWFIQSRGEEEGPEPKPDE
jgi:hypothetical protein